MQNLQYYSAEFIQEMKEELQKRQEQIIKQLKSFAQNDPNQEKNFNAEFPNFGDKEDENAAEVAAFESNLSMEETMEQSLEMVDRALRKIENGTYGICEKTGEPIGEARLRIMPTATKKIKPKS